MIFDPRITEIMSANQILVDRGIRHAVFLERLKTGETRKLVGFLNDTLLPDMLEKLERRLKRIRVLGIDPGPVTTRRLQEAIAEQAGLLKAGFSQVNTNFEKSMLELAKTEVEFQQAILNGIGKPVNISFALPSVGQLQSVIKSRPMRGKLLRDWWKDLEVSTRRDITNQLRIGIASGESIPKIAKRFEGTARAAFKDGVYGRLRRNTESIARTAVNHVTTQARETLYGANEDVVKAVQIVAVLDSRTTQICMSLDGQQFPVNEGERPPFHHQ